MSKASQRRLAEQRKRNSKKVLPNKLDILKTMAYGVEAIDEVPLSFWRCVASTGKPQKKHRDDADLEAFFERYKGMLESLHDAALGSIEFLGQALPGLSIHRITAGEEVVFEATKPMAISGLNDLSTFDAISQFLKTKSQLTSGKPRLAIESQKLEMTLGVWGLECTELPLMCVGITDSGASFVRMRVEGQWIKGTNSELVDMSVQISDKERRVQQEAYRTTVTTLMNELSELLGVDTDNVSEELENAMRQRVHFHLKDLARPYLDLALDVLDQSEEISMEIDEATERAQELERSFSELQKTSRRELQTVERQLQSHLARRNHAPQPSKQTTKQVPEVAGGPRPVQEHSLAERLAGFF